MHSILTNPKIQTKLEKQSKTAITFDPGRIGEAWIYGSDTLAVTLAFSAVEDIITKYSEDGDTEGVLESPNARLASSRLDSELHRLHAQDKEIIYDDDYSKMPDAVKRSILNWYLEDPNASNEEPQSDIRTPNYGIDHMDEVTNKLDNTKLTSRSPSMQKPEAANSIGYLAKPSDFTVSGSYETSIPPMSLPQENSLLRETGLSRGYTEKEIDTVLASSVGPMRTSDFIKALVANKKLERAATVSDDRTNVKSKKTESYSEVDQVASAWAADSGVRHPMDNFLSNDSSSVQSDQLLSQSPKSPKEGNDQNQFVDYFAKLSQDFKEEEGEVPIEELKRRSQERQKLLLDAFMKQKIETQSQDNSSIQEEDDVDENDPKDILDDDKADNPRWLG